MKTKIAVFSTNDVFITIPLLKKISLDSRIDLKKVFFFKEKNSFIKKIKILILLSFKDFINLTLLFLNSILQKKTIFKSRLVKNINSQDLINLVNQLNVDIIICINCPQIISDNTIKEIKVPIFNFHPGDLPSFRGVLIPFFLMKNKIREACLTFHKIDKFIDKGQLINKKYISLSDKETLLSIYKKIFLSKKSYNFIINSIIDHSEVNIKFKKNLNKYYNYPSIIEILKFRVGIK
ncbi:hypothetical protein IDH28_00265 [Pelagibacterales bacterium SAG-MED31]|nr:hypothetical protein [Pelagibacterales bacterium SAG-MED31]